MPPCAGDLASLAQAGAWLLLSDYLIFLIGPVKECVKQKAPGLALHFPRTLRSTFYAAGRSGTDRRMVRR